MTAVLSSSAAMLVPQVAGICAAVASRQKIEVLRALPQVEMPLTHRFQDGVYIREILMPTDTWVVGHVHKTRHWNIVVSGRAVVSVSGGPPKVIQAGDVFESEAGAQKWLYVAEAMRFLTVHANPSDERNIATLEESLIEMPEAMLLEKGSLTLDEFRMSANQLLQ